MRGILQEGGKVFVLLFLLLCEIRDFFFVTTGCFCFIYKGTNDPYFSPGLPQGATADMYHNEQGMPKRGFQGCKRRVVGKNESSSTHRSDLDLFIYWYTVVDHLDSTPAVIIFPSVLYRRIICTWYSYRVLLSVVLIVQTQPRKKDGTVQYRSCSG